MLKKRHILAISTLLLRCFKLFRVCLVPTTIVSHCVPELGWSKEALSEEQGQKKKSYTCGRRNRQDAKCDGVISIKVFWSQPSRKGWRSFFCSAKLFSHVRNIFRSRSFCVQSKEEGCEEECTPIASLLTVRTCYQDQSSACQGGATGRHRGRCEVLSGGVQKEENKSGFWASKSLAWVSRSLSTSLSHIFSLGMCIVPVSFWPSQKS